MDFEAELAAVICKPCRSIAPEDADACILGYTCLNDVTARDLQPLDGQWTRAKGFDTFAPMGPWIETEFDPYNAPHRIPAQREDAAEGQHRHDDARRAGAGRLCLVRHDAPARGRGDAGTPEGVGPMQPGDVIEVRIGGIGTLKNTVKAEE